MNGCPITCPCRRGGEGAFLLALCAFAAWHGRVFLGGDFDALVTGLVHPPHALSPALAVWSAVAVAGLALLLIGIRALLREGDSPPARSSLAAFAAAAIALSCGWYPPSLLWIFGATSPAWALGVEGIYCAVIAGAAENLILALGAQVWMAGHVAAGGSYPRPRAVPFDPDKWRALLEKQEKDIASLTGHAQELEAVLRFPLVKKAVLKALHPDAHAGADNRQRRTLTEQFQTASAVFDRLEQPEH